jgi:tRNA pseudouridine38-40 synthase
MQRYFIHLAYRGSAYCGWQEQPGDQTVQGTLHDALAKLLRVKFETVGCGRTDTGVHASSFFAHFDADFTFDIEKTAKKLNAMLPADIAVYQIFPVATDMHARFSATQRSYTYHLHTQKDPFSEGLSVFTPYQLNVDLMNEGAQILLQTRDFASFCKAGGNQHTTFCTLTACGWLAHSKGFTFEISADRFLRNMVRSIVGTMVDLGRGKIDLQTFKAIVDAKDRTAAGTSVAAHGLFLKDVRYPFS